MLQSPGWCSTTPPTPPRSTSIRVIRCPIWTIGVSCPPTTRPTSSTHRVDRDTQGQLLADPNANLADLSPLSAEDRYSWTHRSGKPADTEALLPDLLTRGGTSGLERIAIRSRTGDLTYGELDAVSSQLARVLIDRGVEPETRVIVALPRSAELVTAVLAIAKAGGAHVPVDPGYPRDRIRHMITDSGATLGITTSQWHGALPGDIEWLRLDNPTLRTDRALRAPTPITDADRIAAVRPDHAAYLIYTSGSTGTPKDVVVTHRGWALVQDFGDRTSGRCRSRPPRRSHNLDRSRRRQHRHPPDSHNPLADDLTSSARSNRRGTRPTHPPRSRNHRIRTPPQATRHLESRSAPYQRKWSGRARSGSEPSGIGPQRRGLTLPRTLRSRHIDTMQRGGLSGRQRRT